MHASAHCAAALIALTTTGAQVYDIFRSSKTFSPKNPGLPVARICLAGPSVPSIYDIIRAERASPDVPVKWAICRNGTVAFQGFETC